MSAFVGFLLLREVPSMTRQQTRTQPVRGKLCLPQQGTTAL
mgnify:CR=1 FL=1